MKRGTKQIFIMNLNYPYESVHKLLFESELIKKIFENSEFKIKLFIGSDWSIQNSGFCFYGPNGLYCVFELKYFSKDDFMRRNIYSILQINMDKKISDIDAEFSLIQNTCDNTCIMEMRLNYQSEQNIIDFENSIKISYLKEILNKIMTKIKIFPY